MAPVIGHQRWGVEIEDRFDLTYLSNQALSQQQRTGVGKCRRIPAGRAVGMFDTGPLNSQQHGLRFRTVRRQRFVAHDMAAQLGSGGGHFAVWCGLRSNRDDIRV